MAPLNFTEVFKQAIITAQQIRLGYKNGFGNNVPEQIFHPYVFGSDIYQHSFVWGYLPYTMTFYKFFLDNITEVFLTDISYTVLPEAMYLYAAEEEHQFVLHGFYKFFSQQATPIANEGEAPEPSTS